jgi:hypothetical protein
MKAIDKANELIVKVLIKFERITLIEAKKIVLMAVDEILDVDCFDMSEEHFDNHIEFWEEVKQEIEKL